MARNAEQQSRPHGQEREGEDPRPILGGNDSGAVDDRGERSPTRESSRGTTRKQASLAATGLGAGRALASCHAVTPPVAGV